MAAEGARPRIRWGVVVVVAAGVALGVMFAERIEERISTRIEERAAVRDTTEPPPQPGPDCTDGVDCYCDRVTEVGNPIYDPNLLMCEDFEAITLHENVNFGGGAPLYGPWYDHTARPGWRGRNSFWARTYGGTLGGCSWLEGTPATPILGDTCELAGNCWVAEYHPNDLWQGNSQACIDIVANGEFNAEIPRLRDPVVPGQHSGVFQGAHSMSHRVQQGRVAGIIGAHDFGQTVYELGVTMAMAYPDNTESSGIWNNPWKHNEWRPGLYQAGDGPFFFHNLPPLQDNDPFQQFFIAGSAGGNAQCAAALAGATIRRGTAYCSGSAFFFQADPNYYQRSVDWPFSTWGCARGHAINLGGRATMRIWFHETLIVDLDVDTTPFRSGSGYRGLIWNAYSNANQTPVPTTETTFRYEDNIHITHGPPVPCTQIGFLER